MPTLSDSSINNTPNSLDACNPTRNATVSASAGSGKTWLLITRIVRLLIDGAEPGNIIALTFTRKAAGEMQIRLNQRLFEMATVDEQKLDELLAQIDCDNTAQNRDISRKLYEKLIHSLYPIRIQTFHSFCQDILSRFPLEADIPPGFELIEDSSLLELQARHALFDIAGNASKKQDKSLSNNLANNLDTIMLACNGPENTKTALRNFLSNRSDWWAYTSHVKDPVDFAGTELKKALNISVHADTGAHDPIEQFLTEETTNKLLNFANLLTEINNTTSKKFAATIDAALKSADKNDDNNFVYHSIRTAFIKKDGEPLAQGRKHTPALEKKLGIENAERFIELHNELASEIQSIDETLKKLATFNINTAWYYAGQQYVKIFQQLKREMRLLDFTDLEWKCFQLLQSADNAHWIQYKIDQRIDHLLIDEFQDTNPTQWQLLSPILDEIAANPEERQRTVFLVGDEKQSIYSFRRANPALQAQATEWLAQNLDARATPLDFSRRSSSAIIHTVNQIFQQDAVKAVMTGYTTHDTYLNKLPGKVLLCELFEQAEDGASEETPENTSEDRLQHDFRNPLKQPREVSEKTLRHQEADYIAEQILQLVNDRECITDDNRIRPIEYGDILILMRNRVHFKIYENALKQQGIPFIGSKKGGLLDNLEIQDLICLLNTLITPFNNLALAQVLKSPIFNASDDDLMLLARQATNSAASSGNTTTAAKPKQWYQHLLQLATQTKDNPSKHVLSKALQRASTLLPDWQKLAEQLPVHDCLDKIFSQGNIINRYIAANRQENKQKVAANCQRFLELSLETDSGRYPSITRFLQHLNHLKTYSESPPEEPLSQSDNSRVRLMTIHGSKGLEAPVVFLADCNSTARNKNAYTSLVRWPANKAQPTSFQLQLSKDKTDAVTQNLQAEKLKEQSREELNLLYVALTRAREQLYISGVKNRSNQNNSWYQLINTGFAEISRDITTVGENNARIYEHLSYPDCQHDKTEVEGRIDNKRLNDQRLESKRTVIEFDKRLLKPVEKMPKPSFMIAPSSNTDGNIAYPGSQIFSAGAGSELDVNSYSHDASLSNEHSTAALAKWRGVTIHRALELLCKAEVYPATDDTIKILQQQLSAETSLRDPAYAKHLDDCIEEACTTFNHPDLTAVFHPGKDSKTYNEMPLMYMHGQQAVHGIVDRLIKTPGNVSIIDYKSHQLESCESITVTAQQFKGQLTYYREGIEKLWPQHTIKTGVLFTHYQQIVWLHK